jgi:hypothetical protein
MNWKSTAAVSGVTLLATWLGLTPARHATVGDAPVVTRDVRVTDTLDIQQQAARLQTRVRSELGYRDPKRNLFRFAIRPAPVAPQVPHPVVSPVTPVAIPEVVPFSLSGMATDTVDGQPQRTAILMRGSDVLFVKEGDRVGSYTVTRVDDAGVDVLGADGGLRRLTLTP